MSITFKDVFSLFHTCLSKAQPVLVKYNTDFIRLLVLIIQTLYVDHLWDRFIRLDVYTVFCRPETKLWSPQVLEEGKAHPFKINLEAQQQVRLLHKLTRSYLEMTLCRMIKCMKME